MKFKKIFLAVLLIVILTFTFVACKKDIEINGFSIDLSNVSLEIEQGTDFDFSKVSVNATRVDDTSILLTQGVDYTIDVGNFDKDVPGEYTIAVKYGSYATKNFVVKVKAADSAVTVNSIVVEGAAQKTSFAYNEDFNYAGLAIKVFYTDYTNAVITEGYTVDSTEYNKAHGFSSIKEYIIVVNFAGKSTTYSVSVEADPSKVMKSIAAAGNKKTQYNYYEDFTREGLALQITMMDNSTSTITGGFELDSSAFNNLHGMDTAQTYNIKLSYMSLETNYDVVVARAKVINLAVVASEEDKTFKYNVAFSLNNVKVFAQYENSTYVEELTVANAYGAGNFLLVDATYNSTHEYSSEEHYNIYVKYSDTVSTYYTVTVAARPEFVGFEVGGKSTQKTVFAENEDFDLTGLIIEVVYGSLENNNLYVRTAEEDEYTVVCETFDSSVKGDYAVYVSYNYNNYLLYYVYVNIDDGSNAESITANILTNTYYERQPINYSGSYITVFYDNSTQTNIYLPNSAVDVTGFNSSTVGSIALTITYGELTTTVENIQIIEDIIVYIQLGENSKQRTNFYFLENFTSEGLIVEARWQSNKLTTLSSSEYNINEESYSGSEAGYYTIGISYEGFETDYSVYVTGYFESREPQDIYYSFNGDYYDAVKVSDGNWIISCGTAGDGSLEINLGEDYLSSVSVMRGRWFFGGVFLELSRNPMEKFVISYDGVTNLELTIRVTTLSGTSYYSYVTIKQSIFNFFKINGEQVIFDSNDNATYRINDISNTYVIDWEINAAYTVTTEIKKLQSYTLNSYDTSCWYEFYVKIDDDTTISYNIEVFAFILVSSVSVNNEVTEIDDNNNRYFLEWDSYAINEDYDFVINTYSGYTSTLEYRGKSISSINGNILFAGGNFFDIIIRDNNNNIVASYELTIYIVMSSDDIYVDAQIRGIDFATEYLNYYGSPWSVGFIATNSGKRIDLDTIELYFSLVADSTVSIEGITWSNGGNLTLVPGKNEFILILSDGVNTYKSYLIIYYQVDKMDFWNNHNATFNGAYVEYTDTVPTSDTAIIKIPDGFVYNNDNINTLIKFESSGVYECSVENNELLIVIKYGYIESELFVLEGFGYIIVIIDGQVNADTDLEFYIVPIINLATETIPDTSLPFTYDNASRNYLANLELPEVSFMVFEAPYFATVDFTCDNEEAIQYMGWIYTITGAVDATFTLTFIITSSDGTTTATYIVSITIVASPNEFELDFGTEDIYEYGMMDLIFAEDGQVLINVPLEGLGDNVLDIENMTASFTVISDKLYVGEESDVIKVVSGEVASYVLKVDEEGVYYVEFIYFLDYEANSDIMLRVRVAFSYPEVK